MYLSKLSLVILPSCSCFVHFYTFIDYLYLSSFTPLSLRATNAMPALFIVALPLLSYSHLMYYIYHHLPLFPVRLVYKQPVIWPQHLALAWLLRKIFSTLQLSSPLRAVTITIRESTCYIYRREEQKQISTGVKKYEQIITDNDCWV